MAIQRTVNRLIRAVLSDVLNVYNPEQTISAADAQTVKEAIQDRLAAWAADINIPVITLENKTLTPAKASYTVGEYGSPDLDTPRPEQIVGAYIRDGDTDYPVKIWTEKQYRSITDKSTSGRPTILYPSYATPNITIYLYPVPDAADVLYISSLKHYTEPTTYTEDTFDTTGLPGNVYNALKWRVAVDVAPGFRAELHPSIAGNASDAYNDMIALNLARNMTPTPIEFACRGQGGYSLQDFFGGD